MALFQKAGFIDDQNGIGIGQGLQRIVAHDIAQGIGIPRHPTEDRLLPPGTLVACGFRPHPAGLAPFVSQQAIQKLTGRCRNPFLCEQNPHPRLHVPKRRSPKLQRFLDSQSRHP